MTDYRQFDVLDFVQDEAFQRWAEGNASLAEAAFWQQWLTENPAKRPLLEQAALTVRTLGVKETPLSEGTVQQEVQRILQTVRHDGAIRPLHPPRRLWWSAAAAVLLLVGIGGGVWFAQRTKTPVGRGDGLYEAAVADASVPLLERRNNATKPLPVTLPDQSVVTLEPGSRLSYPARFAPDSRTVYLSGDAFFEVTPNARRPFLVFANETVTKVLGTSFRVSAQPQARRVTVRVRTGLVAVMPKAAFSPTELGTLKTAKGVLITPNQQVIFEREAATLRRSIVERPALLPDAPATNAMTFEDTPVVDVLTALERAYGIDIVYNAENLKNCTLRASLYDEPLFDKLTLICKTLGLSYQVIDTQIVLTGRGCGQ